MSSRYSGLSRGDRGPLYKAVEPYILITGVWCTKFDSLCKNYLVVFLLSMESCKVFLHEILLDPVFPKGCGSFQSLACILWLM